MWPFHTTQAPCALVSPVGSSCESPGTSKMLCNDANATLHHPPLSSLPPPPPSLNPLPGLQPPTITTSPPQTGLTSSILSESSQPCSAPVKDSDIAITIVNDTPKDVTTESVPLTSLVPPPELTMEIEQMGEGPEEIEDYDSDGCSSLTSSAFGEERPPDNNLDDTLISISDILDF